LNYEEDAFWALNQLMTHSKYQMHGFFIPGFPKLKRFQDQHDKILRRKLKRIEKHFLVHGVDTGIYTLKWFFQCYLDRLPFSIVIRIWDLYLLEGECIMFAVAYTILKIHRKVLLKMGMDEILEFLQKTLEKEFVYEDDYFIETALRENLAELKSIRLHTAGPTPENEFPKTQFGVIKDPSREQDILVGRRVHTDKTEFNVINQTKVKDNERNQKGEPKASLDSSFTESMIPSDLDVEGESLTETPSKNFIETNPKRSTPRSLSINHLSTRSDKNPNFRPKSRSLGSLIPFKTAESFTSNKSIVIHSVKEQRSNFESKTSSTTNISVKSSNEASSVDTIVLSDSTNIELNKDISSPHIGEVVRIHVPYSKNLNNGDNKYNNLLTEENIQRLSNQEISQSFNGHSVIIKVQSNETVKSDYSIQRRALSSADIASNRLQVKLRSCSVDQLK